MATTRRQFLGSAVGSGLALSFLSKLDPVSAADAKLDPSLVKLDDSIEPTVRLLEETSRERVLEEVASRIKTGLSYREVLAALLLAGVRNVQPRPQVGFKFHAVLVINSAHLASINSPDSDRWLPIFWAIDRFKSAQLETQKTSGWRMSAVQESRVPSGAKARQAFIDAMDNWEEDAADLAAASLARNASRDECFELFARYGARDFRDIGHKAIFVANSFRTLDCIGWQNAEPVLRSLAYALLKYDGEKPSKTDAAPDRPWRENTERLKKVRPDWQYGRRDLNSDILLLGLHAASHGDAAGMAEETLKNGASVDAVWDAMLAGAAELLMRKPGIVSLHAVTSANALHFAFKTVADPQLRLMLLLQNASFLGMFHRAIGDKALSENRSELIGLPSIKTHGKGADAVAEILADATGDRPTAAGKAIAYLDEGNDPKAFMNAARRLVFLKGNDAHDYKYSSAVLEDFYAIAPKWRNRYLATSMYYLPGSGAKDNSLVQRIRAAFST